MSLTFLCPTPAADLHLDCPGPARALCTGPWARGGVIIVQGIFASLETGRSPVQKLNTCWLPVGVCAQADRVGRLSQYVITISAPGAVCICMNVFLCLCLTSSDGFDHSNTTSLVKNSNTVTAAAYAVPMRTGMPLREWGWGHKNEKTVSARVSAKKPKQSKGCPKMILGDA